MRLIIITGSLDAFPLLQYLISQQALAGVVLNKNLCDYYPMLPQQLGFASVPYTVLNEAQSAEELLPWMNAHKADAVLVCGLSLILKEQFMAATGMAFYNMHFSLLPAYKGPQPIFWQLRNGETTSGISVHRITNKIDSGEIVAQQAIPIDKSDNSGLLRAKLNQLSLPVLADFLLFLKGDVKPSFPENLTESPLYARRLEQDDLKINWQGMTATQIEQLVNATNPDYQGAISLLNGQEIRLLSVREAAGEVVVKASTNVPGTIFFNEASAGIFVSCSQGTVLELEIVLTALGTFTACRWVAAFGIPSGSVIG